MSIDLVFITYNRLQYTRLALHSILADPTEEFRLFIWDNGSTDGTRDYLQNEVRDHRIQDVILKDCNDGQAAAVNTVWGQSKADLLGKLDNDCIVTPGWTRVFREAHRDIPDLGVVACWHFPADDFDHARARHKIQSFGKHQILRHPWTCGTGFLIKNAHYQQFGPLMGTTTTSYWVKMAVAGLINGFYYPLVLQEHMDDPRSVHCQTQTVAGLADGASVTVSIRTRQFKTPEVRWKWREQVISNLLDEPYTPKWYRGWRRLILILRRKFGGW